MRFCLQYRSRSDSFCHTIMTPNVVLEMAEQTIIPYYNDLKVYGQTAMFSPPFYIMEQIFDSASVDNDDLPK